MPSNSSQSLATEWTKAVDKGHRLLSAMNANEELAGTYLQPPMAKVESPFLKFPDDLKDSGYEFIHYDKETDFDVSVPIKKALEGLNLNTRNHTDNEKKGKNHGFYWQHETEKTIDGIAYKPTNAYFIMVLNPEDGVIISLASYGPVHMGSKQKPKVTVVPKLKAYSDITFLQWHGLAEGMQKDMTHLKYIFRTPVENANTESLIQEALSNVKKELDLWPGVDFEMSTDEGKAILGSPNGAGCAYLLLQHKAQLGVKTISKVTVFQDDGAAKPRPPSMVFHVKDVVA